MGARPGAPPPSETETSRREVGVKSWWTHFPFSPSLSPCALSPSPAPKMLLATRASPALRGGAAPPATGRLAGPVKAAPARARSAPAARRAAAPAAPLRSARDVTAAAASVPAPISPPPAPFKWRVGAWGTRGGRGGMHARACAGGERKRIGSAQMGEVSLRILSSCPAPPRAPIRAARPPHAHLSRQLETRSTRPAWSWPEWGDPAAPTASRARDREGRARSIGSRPSHSLSLSLLSPLPGAPT